MVAKKFKIITIQKNNDYIQYILGKSIPKGIIIYYSLVSIIDASTLDKNVKKLFLDSSFFSFSKKLNYLNIRFLYCLTCLVVLFPPVEGVGSAFTRQLTRQARQQLLSKTTHYSQNKLSQTKIQDSENFGNNINDKKLQITTKSRCQNLAVNYINAICATTNVTRNS